MTPPPDLDVTVPPEVQVPQRRFWGDRTPPKNRADMFSVRAALEEVTPGTPTNVATLRLYGPIDSWGGWWGISAQDVAAALDALGDDIAEVRVRVNSPGGEAWEGMAILNLLRAHRAKVVAVVDGIAASAASVIVTGCDETVMSPGTQLMVHDASAFAWGPAETMRKAARFLDSVSDSIASIYAETAGGTVAAWRAVMVEETWYTAQEAVAAGLADQVAVVSDAGETTTAGDAEPDLDDVEDRFDLSIYAHAGRSHAPAPRTPAAAATGDPIPSSPTRKDRSDAVAEISDEQLNTLREQVGCDADADLDTVLAAVPEALSERADTTPETNTGGQDQRQIPDGMTLVETDVLATLQAGAQDGVTARAQQLRDERDRAVTAAVADGRITPASRERWQNRWDADADGTRELLAGLPAGLVPVDERGHDDAGEPVAASTVSTVVESDAYKNWSLS